MNSKELRKKFLEDACPVVEHMVAEATGKKSPLIKGQIQPDKLNEVWKAVVPMMQSANDTVKVQAESSREVINAVCEGKLTLTEAERLMALMKEQWEMEALPDLLAQYAAYQKLAK